ncbi:ABC transporter permease [Nonomuraea sp. SYSU D8015]|uniref:ABC transporter permease n=1 Tax=Nonomuraea sp. SYSU D8015 TaxID=2593644 RepID=UPI0016617BAD|nr:ABC transporter permease [Nonomuraea sp. SYSU D8015]
MGRLASSARLVVVGGMLAYRALFNWTTPAMFVGTLLAAPLLRLAFFVYLGRRLGIADDRFFVLGNTVLAASFVCVYGGTMAVANERRYGTLGAILLSPRGRLTLWLGRALPYVINAILVVAFTLGVSVLVFDVELAPGELLALVPVFLAGIVSCAAFGLTLGAIGLRARDVFLTANVAASLLLLLTGANIPASALPGWMAVGRALPLTHSVAATQAITEGSGPAELLPYLGWELAVGLGYATLACLLLRYFEYGSRRRGTLDTV